MRFIIISIFILLLSNTSFAQIESNTDVQLTGSSDSQRQFSGLHIPQDSLNAVSAYVITANSIITGNSSGSGFITLTLSPGPTTYSPGMIVYLLPDSVNKKAANIRINNLPFVPLLGTDGEPVSAGVLFPGQAFRLIFDGVAFRTDYISRKVCPDGFVNVNKDFCIETDESSPVISSQAVNNCYSKGARLCTFGEWYLACQDASLNLQNTTNNWEWIDDSSNHSNTMDQVGLNGCTSNRSITIPTTLTFTYRCCYSK